MYPWHTPSPIFNNKFHNSALVTGSDILYHCYEYGLIIQPTIVE